MAKLTIFTSDNILTKRFWRDGRVEKSPALSSGTFEVLDIPDHESLKDLIQSLTHQQALCYSIPFGYSSGRITTKGNEDEENSVISRSDKYFDYANNEGWLFIDCDENLE